MSEPVKRWDHAVRWEGLKIAASYMAIKGDGKYVLATDHDRVAQERDQLRVEVERLMEENKRLGLMVAQADFSYDQDRYRMSGLLKNALVCLGQWNLKHPRIALRGDEYSSENTYRQIREFLPEYRDFDAALPGSKGANKPPKYCAADRDGECTHAGCPQLSDWKTSCPIPDYPED